MRDRTNAPAHAAAPDPQGPGERVFRLAAVKDGIEEARYFLSAYEANAWRKRLVALDAQTSVTMLPVDAFVPVDEQTLEKLAAEEQHHAAHAAAPDEQPAEGSS